jgi:hypothetical protein
MAKRFISPASVIANEVKQSRLYAINEMQASSVVFDSLAMTPAQIGLSVHKVAQKSLLDFLEGVY